MKRIGLFGGSFNPVHYGHLLAAQEAFERLRLDQIIFMPCAQSAYGKDLWPATLRLKLLKAALQGMRGYRVSDREIKRGGVSRSIDTLRALKAKGSRYFLLIGSDQVTEFPKWKEAAALSKLAKICVLARPGSPKKALIHSKYQMLNLAIPKYDISSSQIRTRLKKKLPVTWLLPPSLLKLLPR